MARLKSRHRRPLPANYRDGSARTTGQRYPVRQSEVKTERDELGLRELDMWDELLRLLQALSDADRSLKLLIGLATTSFLHLAFPTRAYY